MGLKVYNTLTRKKEEFIPAQPGKVGMYICGPTVYNYIHIGNARCYLVFDVIKRYLKFKGFEVLHVQNFTDIDDKIINRAQEEKVSTDEIAEKYTLAFEEDMDSLKVDPPDIKPKATEHLEEMIATIEALVEKGIAYEVEGDVYFAVSKFEGYGKLSQRTLEDMRAGERVEVDPKKQHPLDFALWKKAKPGEPSWPSPWGEGRPGWHIECSSMSLKYLGMSFDIHGGGQDLIFPHHENEIAQAEASQGKGPFVRYWLHNGFVNVGIEKMAKSLGNVILVRDVLRNYPPVALRTLFLGTHWRSPISFTEESLKEGQEKYQRLIDVLVNIDDIVSAGKEGETETMAGKLDEACDKTEEKFAEAMDDDFNTASALASLFELAQDVNLYLQAGGKKKSVLEKCRNIIVKLGEVLGLDLPKPGTINLGFTLSKVRKVERKEEELFSDLLHNLDGFKSVKGRGTPKARGTEDHLKTIVEDLLSLREEARNKKEWARADNIRDRLSEAGILVEDRPTGIRWRLK